MAAENMEEKNAKFNSNIDAWAVGEISELNADNGSFTIRGHKLPYASDFSVMQQEITKKTADLPADQRAGEQQKIENAWQDRLDRAKNEAASKDAEMTFNPPKTPKVMMLNDKCVQQVAFLHQDRTWLPPLNMKMEEGQMVTYNPRDAKELDFRELKIGDKVLVGYQSGLVMNDAYVVVGEKK
jgi:hypothetical protein